MIFRTLAGVCGRTLARLGVIALLATLCFMVPAVMPVATPARAAQPAGDRALVTRPPAPWR